MTPTHPARRFRNIAWTMGLLAIALLWMIPLIWMFSTALKPTDQTLSGAFSLLPRVDLNGDGSAAEMNFFSGAYWSGVAAFIVSNLRDVWTSPSADFPTYFKNTLIVSILSVSGMIISSAIVAYGFARVRWRGRNAVFVLVLATMMIPFPVLMAPLYVLFKQFGWIGSLKPLWVPAWFGGAFSIFLLRQFFLTIPRELDEAAMIDGCSHARIFWRIILPLSKPAIVVVILFQFIATWNDFVGPLLFLNHQEQYTLALGLSMYQSQHGGTPWNLVMMASVLTVLPVLILFLLSQRAFIHGVATQGIKE